MFDGSIHLNGSSTSRSQEQPERSLFLGSGIRYRKLKEQEKLCSFNNGT